MLFPDVVEQCFKGEKSKGEKSNKTAWVEYLRFMLCVHYVNMGVISESAWPLSLLGSKQLLIVISIFILIPRMQN